MSTETSEQNKDKDKDVWPPSLTKLYFYDYCQVVHACVIVFTYDKEKNDHVVQLTNDKNVVALKKAVELHATRLLALVDATNHVANKFKKRVQKDRRTTSRNHKGANQCSNKNLT